MHIELNSQISTFIRLYLTWHIHSSDVARPLSYRPRPPIFSRQDRSAQDHFFKTKTTFFKDHQIINLRPQKTFP